MLCNQGELISTLYDYFYWMSEKNSQAENTWQRWKYFLMNSLRDTFVNVTTLIFPLEAQSFTPNKAMTAP